MRTLCFSRYMIILSIVVCCQNLDAGQKAVIVVNQQPFGSVQEAAYAENRGDFWDDSQQDETACTESYAAVELKNFLISCTNLQDKDIAFSTTDSLPSADYLFLLGSRESNPFIAKYNKDAAELKTPQSFRIKTAKSDNTTICIIEGKSRIGTLYGVYEYLNRLGVQFIGLGEMGTVLPTEKRELFTEISIVENPAFLTRGYCTRERNNVEDKFFIWMGRNRMNLWAAGQDNKLQLLKKLGIQLADGFHEIQLDYLNPQHEYPYNHTQFQGDEDKPDDPYKISPEFQGDSDLNETLTNYEAHPEWFGYHDKKRSHEMKEVFGHNFCTSNHDAIEEFSKNFIQGLIDGKMRHADIIYFWMLDAGIWCECDSCKGLGNNTDRLLILTYQVNQKVQQATKEGRLPRPIHLSTLAYMETITPPSRPLPDDFDYENCSVTYFPIRRCYAHSLADPTCTEINHCLYDSYMGWKNNPYYKGPIFIGEYYNLSSYKSLPIVYSTILSVDIPWYYNNGARHFHYMHNLTDLWGSWTINEFLLSRFLWNPQADADSLLNMYYEKYYPTTSKTTRAFYEYLEKAMSNISAWRCTTNFETKDHYSLTERLKDKSKPLFQLDHLRYDVHKPDQNDAYDFVEIINYIRLARKNLDESLMNCENPKEKERLLEEDLRFTYGETTCFYYYHIIRTTTFDRRGDESLARNEFKHLRDAAEKLMSIKKEVNVSSEHGNKGNGFEATYTVIHYNNLKRKYGTDVPEADEN